MTCKVAGERIRLILLYEPLLTFQDISLAAFGRKEIEIAEVNISFCLPRVRMLIVLCYPSRMRCPVSCTSAKSTRLLSPSRVPVSLDASTCPFHTFSVRPAVITSRSARTIQTAVLIETLTALGAEVTWSSCVSSCAVTVIL